MRKVNLRQFLIYRSCLFLKHISCLLPIKKIQEAFLRISYIGFIWLIDKTGRKIFEGDVLKGHEGSIYRVWREKGGFSISDIELNDPFPSYPLCDKQIASYVEAGCEVIGNIYDNPELIK